MARPARVIVEDDGTVWEPGEEAWKAMEKLTGHEAEDDRADCAGVRGFACEPVRGIDPLDPDEEDDDPSPFRPLEDTDLDGDDAVYMDREGA